MDDIKGVARQRRKVNDALRTVGLAEHHSAKHVGNDDVARAGAFHKQLVAANVAGVVVGIVAHSIDFLFREIVLHHVFHVEAQVVHHHDGVVEMDVASS